MFFLFIFQNLALTLSTARLLLTLMDVSFFLWQLVEPELQFLANSLTLKEIRSHLGRRNLHVTDFILNDFFFLIAKEVKACG